MKPKINNSLKEEFVSINALVNKMIKELKSKRKLSIIFWSIFSALIALFNIAILILSSIALEKVLNDYHSNPTSADFLSQVFPTVLVSIVSIATFILSLVTTIYQGFMKSKVYLSACEDIQYETIRYFGDKNESIDTAEFKKRIRSIRKTTYNKKSNMKIHKALLSVLTGGSDE